MHAMQKSIQLQIRDANAALLEVIRRAREALNGREDFHLENIRAIAVPLEQMGPIVARAAELRSRAFNLGKELQEYTENLSALYSTLDQINFMLLARRNSLQASRGHIESLNLWASTLNQTR
jgi:hypothetical protein